MTPAYADAMLLAARIPLPLIGAAAIGIPVLIVVLFFVFWDDESRKHPKSK